MSGKPAKIVIHIGPHKTGTSSLQKVLAGFNAGTGAGALYYPKSGRMRGRHSPGHHRFSDRLRRNDLFPVAMQNELSKAPPGSQVVISCEKLCTLGSGDIHKLGALTRFAPVQIVYFARRADGLLPSFWQETVKHGASEQYSDFAGRRLADPLKCNRINHCVVLDAWAGAFGKDAIKVVSYDNLKSISNTNTSSYFVREILEQDVDLAETKFFNQSMAPEKTEIIRVLNFLAFGNVNGGASVRKIVNKANGDLAEWLVGLEVMLQPFRKVVPAMDTSVLDLVEQAFLEKYRENLLNPAPGGRLFAEKELYETSVVDQSYLREAAIVDALQNIHNIVSALAGLGQKNVNSELAGANMLKAVAG